MPPINWPSMGEPRSKAKLLFFCFGFEAIILIGSNLQARPYTIDWHDISGGGGASTNSTYQVIGTIGHLDDDRTLIGGGYTLAGGFIEAIAPVQESYVAGPGGSIAGGASQLVSYGYATTTVVAVPNTGYHFVGWSDGSTDATRNDLDVISSTVVTAIFAMNTFTLTYDGNGNTGGLAPVDVLGPYNYYASVLVLGPGSLALDGSTFIGWNSKPNGSGAGFGVGSILNITTNTVLYAQWAVNSNSDVPLMATWQLVAMGTAFAGIAAYYRR